MKTFNLKRYSDALAVFVIIGVAFSLFIVYALFFTKYISPRVAIIIIGVLLAAGLRYVLKSIPNSKIVMDGEYLSIKSSRLGLGRKIRLSNISMLVELDIKPQKKFIGDNLKSLEVLNKYGFVFLKLRNEMQQQEYEAFKNTIINSLKAFDDISKYSQKKCYINPAYKGTLVEWQNNRRTPLNYQLLITIIFSVFALWGSYTFFNGMTVRSYEIKADGIYWGSTKIESIDTESFSRIDLDIAKDARNVYLQGDMIESADASTFRRVLDYYADTNYIYVKVLGKMPFTLDLLILENVEANGFQQVGELYKSRNKLYSKLREDPYIREIKIPQGLNVANFKYAGRRRGYYTDQKNIYTFNGTSLFWMKEYSDND